jgi:hypothetical protein
MDSEKKLKELRQAQALIDHLGLESVSPIPSEKPDVVVLVDGVAIGIEVTEVMREGVRNGQKINQTGKEQNNVVDGARQQYENASSLPVMVNVLFGNSPIYEKDRRTISAWLSKLVIDNLPDIGGSYLWDSRKEGPGAVYPPSVHTVLVSRWASMARNTWSADYGVWPEAGIAEAFDKSINDKQSKLSNYLKRCDRCYLLLVEDWGTEAAAFDPPNSIGYVAPQNGFAGVFCLLKFHGLIELECRS